METLFVTESRELLFTGTEDIDVRPLHSPVLHYEGDSREVALRAAHEAAAASKVEGSAFGDFTCYRVGRAPYNGTLYLPAGFHDYGIATLRGLFAALEGGQCEFLCEYQDEIDGVYHGLFEKRI